MGVAEMCGLRSNWPFAIGGLIFATALLGLASLYLSKRSYRLAVLAATQEAVQAASRTKAILLNLDKRGTSMTFTADQYLDIAPSQLQREAFREQLSQKRCVFFDFTPKRRYYTYYLRVVNSAGAPVLSEKVSPGACYCGRPNWRERRPACLTNTVDRN